jgi:hypothetical protein
MGAVIFFSLRRWWIPMRGFAVIRYGRLSQSRDAANVV